MAFDDAQDFLDDVAIGRSGRDYAVDGSTDKPGGESVRQCGNQHHGVRRARGGKSALLSELPFRQAHDIGTFFLQARPAAAEAMERLGAERSRRR